MRQMEKRDSVAMTFADRLDELLTRHSHTLQEAAEKILSRDELLANNADAILELVRAADEYLVTQHKYAKALLSAEVAVENYSDPSVELRWQAVAMSNVSLAEKRLQAALAKLNGEQT